MMDFRLEPRRQPRLGIVMLSSDESLEDEARGLLAGCDVSLLHSRVAFGSDVVPDMLRATEGRLPEAAGLIPQGLEAIAYACTSASVVIGPEAVARQIGVVHPGVAVTNPITAVVTALRALGACRIGLVTPYALDVAGPMRDFLAREGITTLSEISFGESDDRRVARIAEESTLDAVVQAAAADGVEAIFVSCTNLRSFRIIEEAETRTGLPVISSNLALLWDLLRLAHVPSRGWGPGRLFDL